MHAKHAVLERSCYDTLCTSANPTRIFTMARFTVILGRRLPVAFDDVGIPRRLAFERSLAEQPGHECADVAANLCPQGLVVGSNTAHVVPR